MADRKVDNQAMKFPETADIETSSDDYATRFSGATGAWLLEVQTRLTRRLLRGLPHGSLLDVGGGHGQLAWPLADDGWQITVLGSDAACQHRIAGLVEAGRCTFDVGNVIALPYPDRHFDVVICFRLLTHCQRWPELVSELTRVSKGPVIVDYPTSQSFNAIAPALFAAKKKIERNTRTWRLFRHREVDTAFAGNGFKIVARQQQFALPMVLHRALRFAPLSRLLEALCRLCGLTRLLGTPVIVRAERSAAT